MSYLEHATPRVALLYGECVFYIDHYAKQIAQRYPQAQKCSYYFNDYSFNAVVESLSQDSLFGEGSVVLLKLDKKLSAKESYALLEVLVAHPKNALIIGFYSNKNKSAYIQEAKQFGAQLKHPKLDKAIVDVRFFMPSHTELSALLQKKAQTLSLQIDTQALHFLLELLNYDISIACAELEKLALLDHRIEIQDIKRQVYEGSGSVDVEQLIEALFKDRAQSLQVFGRLQSEGGDGPELVRALGRYFYQLFLFASYLKIHGNIQAKEILGFNPPQGVVAQLTKRATQLKDTRRIFEALRAWHVQSIQGNVQAGWHFLIEIQDYLS
ncbi:DNA polymerase III subunit delta [Helicobacter baculiformis]|uniref:DNA polymerase III subunit delta n=1 Tax=Helicobacter baculiformis TaxID=427351 RepID=A0ABV7ZJ64_9HELI|nr:DNA polymerase III [Helicobacter baculiformis]